MFSFLRSRPPVHWSAQSTRELDPARIQMRRKPRETQGRRKQRGGSKQSLQTLPATEERGKKLIDDGDFNAEDDSENENENVRRHLFGILAVGVNLTYTLIPGQATDGKYHQILTKISFY